MTTLWKHGEIPKADIANEGGVHFPRSKKPEQLLRRIIEMSTEPGDIVLDSFLGSGTTELSRISLEGATLVLKWVITPTLIAKPE